MTLPAGTRLGRYEIRSQIGAGGMGDVYLASDALLGRDVALKVLPPQLASDPQGLARFAREARAASALNHPTILTVFDVGDYKLDKVDQDFVDRYVGEARAAVGDEAYEAAFREGRAMRLLHAVALARGTREGGVVARP